MMRKATNHGNIIYFDKYILPTHKPVDLLDSANSELVSKYFHLCDSFLAPIGAQGVKIRVSVTLCSRML